MLQVLLHAQIGEDEGMFSIDDVIRSVSEKMVRRHPHVFGEVSVNDADEVLKNWDEIKKEEKGEEPSSLLASVPGAMPSLMKAHGYQKQAAKVGFDWSEVEPMWGKVQEELAEFQEEVQHADKEKMSDEFGDILFALVNIARFYKIDSEAALAKTNTKFLNRFQYIEEKVRASEKPFESFSLEELDEFWEEAKKTGL